MKKIVKTFFVCTICMHCFSIAFAQKETLRIYKLDQDYLKFHTSITSQTPTFENDSLVVNVEAISGKDIDSLYRHESQFSWVLDFTTNKREANQVSAKRRQNNLSSVYSSDRIDYNSNLRKGISELISKNEFDALLGQKMLASIGESQSENPLLIEQTESTEANYRNPYFVDGMTLSTFWIEFENKTDGYLEFEPKLILQCGSLTYQALSQAYVKEMCQFSSSFSPDYLTFLSAYHLDEKLILPPNSKVKKIMAFKPVDFSQEKFIIHFPSLQGKMIFDIVHESERKIQNKEYYIFTAPLAYKGIGVSVKAFAFASDADNFELFYSKGKLYVAKDSLDKTFNLHLAVVSSDGSFYASKIHFCANNYLLKEKFKTKFVNLGFKAY